MLEVDKVYGVFSLLKREEIYDLKLSFQFVSENMNCVEKKIELTVEEILIPQNADLFWISNKPPSASCGLPA